MDLEPVITRLSAFRRCVCSINHDDYNYTNVGDIRMYLDKDHYPTKCFPAYIAGVFGCTMHTVKNRLKKDPRDPRDAHGGWVT